MNCKHEQTINGECLQCGDRLPYGKPGIGRTTIMSMKHICDNCGAEYTDETLHEVIGNLAARVDPGGIVPSGECTECGALCYPVESRAKVVSDSVRKDLDGLCSYTFEHETKDFIHCLMEEPLYVEEGIITEAEAEELASCGDHRVDEILAKAVANPLCLHVYALATRIYKELLT